MLAISFIVYAIDLPEDMIRPPQPERVLVILQHDCLPPHLVSIYLGTVFGGFILETDLRSNMNE